MRTTTRAIVTGTLVTALVCTAAVTGPAAASGSAPPAPVPAAPADAGPADGLRRLPLTEGAVVPAGSRTARTLAAADAPAEPLPDSLAGAEVRELAVDATVVGLAWEGAAPAAAAVSARVDGAWGPWTEVEVVPGGDDAGTEPDQAGADEAPDAARPDAVSPDAVSPEVVVGDADAVRVAVTGDAGAVTLLAAGGAEEPGAATLADVTPTAITPGALPSVISRRAWGASEVIPSPDCAQAELGSRLERFVVHHTAGTNSYAAAESPGILRGIQSYHVQARGWCDIGYNVLVDKYGQVFEGRRGGLGELVVGVHAAGYNTNTVGVSVLGDYTTASPSDPAVEALISVIGWKSYLHGLDPTGSSPKNGRVLPHVIGHRDVAQTACPGLSIQQRLGEIASRARAQSLTFVPEVLGGTVAPATTSLVTGPAANLQAGLPVPSSWTLTVGSDAGTLRSWTGTATRARTVGGSWTGELGLGLYVVPGEYPVGVDARTTLGVPYAARIGTATLTQPESFVARARTAVLSSSSTAGATEQRALPVDVGVDRRTVTALVLRVRATGSEPVDLQLSPGTQPVAAPVHLRTDAAAADLTQVVVGTGGTGTVTVTRAAGSGPFAVDLVGYLPATDDGVPFWDVPSFELAPDIAWLARRGLTTGNADGSFRPGEAVSRQAMAAFLYRSVGSPAFTPPARATFLDVPPSHPFYREVEWLAAKGIADGTAVPGGSEYRPVAPVSRQAMAAFLARLVDAPTSPGATGFSDVPASSPFAPHVRWLASSGVSRGYDDGTFRPTAPVTRQAMAAFLHRVDDL